MVVGQIVKGGVTSVSIITILVLQGPTMALKE